MSKREALRVKWGGGDAILPCDQKDFTIGIIGDIHGKGEHYLKLISQVDYSIQIGDFWAYDYLEGVDPSKHKFFLGNHEVFPEAKKYLHCLPYWGTLSIGSWSCFYVAGGLSPDRSLRRVGIDWFPEEEMPFYELYEAYKEYMFLKPKVLLAHESFLDAKEANGLRGMSLEPPFAIESLTSQTLQCMWNYHTPREFYHGHWHASAKTTVGMTYIRSLAECEMEVLEIKDQ